MKFFLHPDGSVVLLPKRPAAILRGIVKPRQRRRPVSEPVSLDEMDEAVQQAAAGVAKRGRRRP